MRSSLANLTFSLCAFAFCLISSPVTAGDAAKAFEMRAGAFAHDPKSPERGSFDGNLEFLGPRFPLTLAKSYELFIPRPHFGTTINTAHKTSTAYAGFTWSYGLTTEVFAEASLGGAVHNGKTGDTVAPGYNAMGCTAAFRESGSIGYRINSAISIMGTVEHISNGGLCERNRGLTNGGVRIGYSF